MGGMNTSLPISLSVTNDGLLPRTKYLTVKNENRCVHTENKHDKKLTLVQSTSTKNLQKPKVNTNSKHTTSLQPLERQCYVSRQPHIRTGRFDGAKFYCLHALSDGKLHIRMRKQMLEFSSVVLPKSSPYHSTYITSKAQKISNRKQFC